MAPYSPLPQSQFDLESPSSPSPSLSSRIHDLLTRLRTASLLADFKPRTLRLLAWAGASIVLLALLGLSLNTAGGSSHVTGGGRGSWGAYSSWIGEWRAGKENAAQDANEGDWRDLPENEGLLDPVMVKDEKSGLLMPPDVYPSALNPFKRANAALVALVRNNEREAMRDSMRSLESRFNKKFGYPWVFMNDEPFDDAFKTGVMSLTRSEVFFHVIPREHWSYPSSVNQTYAAQERQKMVDEGVIYGGSESYRHMCRFNSGFFYRQKVLESFDRYWRVEPGVEFFCDIDYDPFILMEANKKVYGFTTLLYEYRRTVETLWDTTREFARLHPEYIHPDNAIGFLVDDQSKGLLDGDWNLCHAWSNFEIGDLRFWRSEAYEKYFEFLDKTGNFFYERWGDAPVHTFGVMLLLPKEALHNFDDIAYRHNPYTHCPRKPGLYENGKCECPPQNSFDFDGYSCMPRWYERMGKPSWET
ncbi:hypothetical protein JCM10207_007449 [Rhodosporidiobolus poonsookiae]